MCTHKKWISNKYGKRILVKCGHCPACLQEKAIKRASRIKNNYKSGQIVLFVTLTYRNDCIPYFYASDFYRAERYQAQYDNIVLHEKAGEYYRRVPVIRDCSVRLVRRGSSYQSKLTRIHGYNLLGDVSIPDFGYYDFKYLNNQSCDKVGVSLYSDVQKFFKRLRINVQREGFPDVAQSIKYFSCSEYGPTTCRPHFHLLLFIPCGSYALIKRAIIKSWTYDSRIRLPQSIQIAKNAASYVSSYVNSDMSLSKTLQSSVFRPRHSYSKGFGFGLECFSLDSVLQAYRQRNLRYTITHNREGALVNDSVLFPFYVLHRYFPKIKGYCRLNANALLSICQTPELLGFYASRLDYTYDDLLNNTRLLRNKIAASGLDPFEYGKIYSNIWTLRASNILEDWYKAQDSKLNVLYAYDNLVELLDGCVFNERLNHFVDDEDILCLETNPNLFPSNLSVDFKLTSFYHKYTKDKKVRNTCYSNFNM